MLIAPFADNGSLSASVTRAAGQVVNIITLMAADIPSAEGSFVLIASPVDTLPAIALIIQTASSTGAIFYNVLFQGSSSRLIGPPPGLPT